MRLKKFEQFKIVLESEREPVPTESEIESFLKENYPTSWFDQELGDRVDDYIGPEEAEDYDGDLIEAYKNVSTGGAVEYDLLKVMCDEVAEHFKISDEYKYDKKIDKRDISDLCHDHMMDNCTWYDRFVFNRKSTEPYKSSWGLDYKDLLHALKDKFDSGDIKL